MLLPLASQKSQAQDTHKTPLQWAELLIEEVLPTDSSYNHKSGSVHWQIAGGQGHAESHTDCSGLLNALLGQSYGLTPTDLKKWLGTRRPLAKTYHDAIVSHNRFDPIERIKEIRPGDMIAIKYPPGGEDTGHAMLVASFAEAREVTTPIQEKTTQWQLKVIDSAMSGHGTKNTRHLPETGFREGLGEGTLLLYADCEGKIVGYAWSNSSKSKFYDLTERHLVVGRYVPVVASSK